MTLRRQLVSEEPVRIVADSSSLSVLQYLDDATALFLNRHPCLIMPTIGVLTTVFKESLP